MASEPTDDGFHDDVKTVVIRTFGSHETAELAAANLKAHGIEYWVNADDCGGMYPNLTAPGGVRLLVRASDAEAAIALLNTQASPSEINQIETEAVASTPPKSVPLRKLALGQILFGIIVGVILCLLYQWTDRFGTKTYRYDSDGDGKPDDISVFRNGRLVEQSFDRNSDGKLDSWNHYDSALQRILSKSDDNFDGVPDSTWRYTNGVLASGEFDTDYNGIPDLTSTFRYDLPTQSDWRPNGTNVVTRRLFFRHGILTEESRDINADGSFDVTIYYDAFQNPIATNTFKFVLPTSPP